METIDWAEGGANLLPTFSDSPSLTEQGRLAYLTQERQGPLQDPRRTGCDAWDGLMGFCLTDGFFFYPF